MATPRKTTRKTTATRKSAVVEKSSSPLARIQLKQLILPLVVVIIVVLLGMFKNQFVVATVNGEPISRIELIKQLEKKDGKSVLDSIVVDKLIKQEAKNKNIQVSDQEVDQEVKNIEKQITDQGQNIDLLLSQQGLTREDLKEQVRQQIELKKLIGFKGVSDQEVDQYIEQNKDSFPEGTDLNSIKPQIKQQLEQQKLSEQAQTYIQQLQEKAKVDYLLNF